jgi:hypothetical protein
MQLIFNGRYINMELTDQEKRQMAGVPSAAIE